MSQSTDTNSSDERSREQREKSFDDYYKKVISTQEHLERINIVTESLKKRYEDYDETKLFVEFLRSVEEVFVHAENERWSVEKTQDEMIKSEIYLMSKMSGVDEVVFINIYEEFQKASQSAEKVQSVAHDMLTQYDSNDPESQACREFIMFVRDSLLVFMQTLSGSEAFDEVSEAKDQIIKMRMESIASNNQPPINVLQNIYRDFVEELKK